MSKRKRQIIADDPLGQFIKSISLDSLRRSEESLLETQKRLRQSLALRVSTLLDLITSMWPDTHDHVEKRVEEEANLYRAISRLDLAEINAALAGSSLSNKRVISSLIKSYLVHTPWGEISEYELASFWLVCSDVLSNTSMLHQEAQWTTVPSVKLSVWCELGLSSLLEQAHQLVSSKENDHLIGIRLRGTGKSSQLAFAQRWLLAHNLPVTWLEFDQLETSIQSSVTLLDELGDHDRESRWLVSAWLAHRIDRQGLLIWSERTAEHAGHRQLYNEFDQVFELDLDSMWDGISSLEFNRFQQPPWLTVEESYLTRADHLRFLTVIKSAPQGTRKYSISDLDAFASLLGPLSPIKVLVQATGSDEEVLRSLLTSGGWVEVDECAYGGGIFAPQSALSWREGLIDGGQRAHQCAKVLIDAIEETYPPSERRSWTLHSALQRLSRLRGREGYSGVIDLTLSPSNAQRAMSAIQPILTQEKPCPLCLATLCGLAFDWAHIGPISGHWEDTLRALQVGAASAERLRDPQIAARVSHLLGKIALQDGRCELAEASLEVSLKLSYATRQSYEATSAARLISESRLLAGDLSGALVQIRKAEQVAQSLSSPQEAWRSRFKEGQIYAASGDHRSALNCWSTLVSGSGFSKNEALIALHIEMARSAIYVEEWAEGRQFLSHLKDENHLMEQVLSATIDALDGDDDPSQILTEAILHTQQSREIDQWLAIQDLRSLIVLSWKNKGHESSSKILTDLESRLGLELSVRVAAGARDRLRLIRVYRQLALIYDQLGDQEASTAALAMSNAWVDEVSGFSLDHFHAQGASRLDEISSHLKEDVKKQAIVEVKKTVYQWSQCPLSSPTSQSPVKTEL